MGFNKKDFEQLSDSLNTSEEFLYAIELFSGEKLEYVDDEDDSYLYKNAAYDLWADGWKEDGDKAKILALLSKEDAEEDEEIFWGGEIACFKKGRWIW